MNNLRPFNSDSGRAAALRRWSKRQSEFQQNMILWAAQQLGLDPEAVALEQATRYITDEGQFAAARAGKTSASKFIMEMSGQAPPTDPGIRVQINQPLIQIANVFDRAAIEDVATDERYLRHLLDTADWNGADELREYALELLNGPEGN